MRQDNIRFVLIIVAVIILVGVLAMVLINKPNQMVCTQEAKLCADGTSVGRNASNNCQFDTCPGIPVEPNAIYCTVESRNVEACTEIYKPVCGWNDPEKIQCIRYPCAQTFGNSCGACQDENVLYWTDGECPQA